MATLKSQFTLPKIVPDDDGSGGGDGENGAGSGGEFDLSWLYDNIGPALYLSGVEQVTLPDTPMYANFANIEWTL